MKKYNEALSLIESEDIFTLRRAIELFEKSEAEDAKDKIEVCKQKIHELYEARRKRKLRKKILILGAVAAVIAILITAYSIFMGNIRARELEIYAKFEGLEFYGACESEQQKEDILWQVNEQTTFIFNKGGTITHNFIYDRVNKATPDAEPQHNETQTTIYTYEVFINTKGDVFLHLEHSLFPVMVDQNDMPYEIQKYHGKTLTLKK